MITAHLRVLGQLVRCISETVQGSLNSIAVAAAELPATILRRHSEQAAVLGFLCAGFQRQRINERFPKANVGQPRIGKLDLQ